MKKVKKLSPALLGGMMPAEAARALGFEPRSKVLETSILPLNYARRKLKAIPRARNSFQ